MFKSKKGFAFSLDAFAAFSLIFAAIYAILLFYSYPKIYLFYLLQAKTISSEVISSLASTTMQDGTSALAYAVASNDLSIINDIIGAHIPNQYGYELYIYENNQWKKLYSSIDLKDPADKHRDKISKLSAHSSFILPLTYIKEDIGSNPYSYPGYCSGGATICDNTVSLYELGKAEVVVVKLVVFA